MALPLGAMLGGAALGGASSLFGGGGRSGEDAGNLFADKPGLTGEINALSPYSLRMSIADSIERSRNNNYGNATNQVQQSPLLSSLFGSGGAMERANAEEQNLASQGFQLTPEDHTAYGQASGNIARLFGAQEQSLAQALADRGLSNSGVAGQQFSGLYGNKNEQLANLQTEIAQKRMQMNQERLNSTRNFLSQMGNQAQNAVGQAFDITNQRNQNEYNMGMKYMGEQQGANERAKGLQNASREQGPTFGSVLAGVGGGALAGGRLAGAFQNSGANNYGSNVGAYVEPGRRVLS